MAHVRSQIACDLIGDGAEHTTGHDESWAKRRVALELY